LDAVNLGRARGKKSRDKMGITSVSLHTDVLQFGEEKTEQITSYSSSSLFLISLALNSSTTHLLI